MAHGNPSKVFGTALGVALASKLLQAEALISEVTRELDLRDTRCTECGLAVRNSHDDFKAHVELSAARRKLRLWAAEIRGETSGTSADQSE